MAPISPRSGCATQGSICHVQIHVDSSLRDHKTHRRIKSSRQKRALIRVFSRYLAGPAFAVFFGLTGIAAAAEVEVLWLGHATVKITSVEGKVIVIDPFLTKNPKAPAKYRDLKALGKVDLILVTHGHGDHVRDLKQLASMTGAKVVAPYGFALNMLALGMIAGDKVIAMNKGGTVTPLGRRIKVHMAPATFSGGEQQRVNIARGFIVDYPILLLDEPTASLDEENREAVLGLICEARDRGAALVGIFHDPGVRKAIGSRYFEMPYSEVA